MKKLLLALSATGALAAGAASAADLPRRAAPPVFTPVPVFTWTGFYIGTETSYTFTDRQRITTVGLSPANVAAVNVGVRPAVTSIEADGFGNVGGGLGYNYQFTPGSGVVVGLGANVDWTDLEKRRGYLSPVFFAPTQFRQSLDYLGTVTGRLGYAFDRFLVYGMGGFAFGGVDTRATFAISPTVPGYFGRRDSMETGYAYGGGIEYAIPTDSFLARFNVLSLLGVQTAAVTFKAEYLHYDLGRQGVVVANINPAVAAGNGYLSRFKTEGNTVRFGFNYKFNGL